VPDGVDDAPQRPVVGGGGTAIRPRIHERSQIRILRGPDARHLCRIAAQQVGDLEEAEALNRRVRTDLPSTGRALIGEAGSFWIRQSSRLNQLRAFEQFARNVLFRIRLGNEIFQP
jgi:hypothetical protein